MCCAHLTNFKCPVAALKILAIHPMGHFDGITMLGSNVSVISGSNQLVGYQLHNSNSAIKRVLMKCIDKHDQNNNKQTVNYPIDMKP